LLEIGLGNMSMAADDFWEMTPREFSMKMKGYFDREMLKERQEWERCRWQTCIFVNTQVTKQINPKELIEFDWEKEERPKSEQMTIEELERIKNLYEKNK